jgi:MFS superfamily sulfate permease-like transporter
VSVLEDEKKAEERAKTVKNERAKLTATYMNGLAVAIVAVGFFAPSFSPQAGATASVSALQLQALTGLLCLIASGILHIGARMILRDLR